MKLSKVRISNFQCFNQSPTEIDFENQLTALIGLNGSGKTSTLQALSRMFGVSESARKIKVDDFHSPSVADQRADKLSIEAWFTFPEAETEDDMIAVAGTFNQLCFRSSGDEMMLRLKLEATLTVDDISPDGVVDETVYYVLTDSDTYDGDKCRELRRSDRNNIQVHYIPASRNPFKEISSSTKMLLGRLLNAIQWDQSADGELHKALGFTEQASEEISKNSAIKLIEKQLQSSWQEMYSGDYLSKAKINFLPLQTDELLKTITLSFESDTNNRKATMDRLSDGQRSLLHISIIQAVHELESKALRKQSNRVHFDAKKLNTPIFTLLALEEPENHLAPHFLGRIVKSMSSLAKSTNAQVLVTTHSPSLVGRIEPTQIRYFRLDSTSRNTVVSKIQLPEKQDELYKFVAGAVKAYPEIYFARLVILGEGESEQIVIPKLLSKVGIDIDDSFVSVAPLGGRHVNHFWKLLNGLGIPYVTLLDMDYGRNGGGWGRVKYVVDQKVKLGGRELLTNIPDWDSSASNPMTSKLSNMDETAEGLLNNNGIFFSTPLDLDYSMQLSYPQYYNEKLFGENGPQNKDWASLKSSVLKSKYSKSIGDDYYDEMQDEKNFLWYNYRFLGSKGKPVSHINALEQIDFNLPENIDRIPVGIKSMIEYIEKEISKLAE
ncbi:AAA family ATPase [Vibrio sp. 10N.261.52.A1]|uniref:ATP-dependent nuclease n=1 Tax=Vibrio TaxID=662 RepID=UPI000CC59FBC|nr:AAA family ATPase [Vibrio sp. 10N.261.52.A1]PML43999.1 ATP-dependent endonuclease [Vibrio sp. 10N.261.52.A1]